jgi:hypothetical protein
MSAWFARVGLPLTPEEYDAIGELVRNVAPDARVVVTSIASWRDAAAFVSAAERDPTWWNQEEEERERLWDRAGESRSEGELLQSVMAMTAGLDVQIRSAASAVAAAAGVTDAAIINEASAMALLAAHQSAVAELAGEGRDHRFMRKYALWEGGRWPLGYHSARFVIF